MKEIQVTVQAISAPIPYKKVGKEHNKVGNEIYCYINWRADEKNYRTYSDISPESFEILSMTKEGHTLSLSCETGTLEVTNMTLGIGVNYTEIRI